MLQLKSFDHSTLPIEINSNISYINDLLVIEFQIEDRDHLLDYNCKGIPSNSKGINNKSNNRFHELWKFTCFEAFWSQPKKENYWELNVNTLGQWNLYHFNSYRQPSPPCENFDFEWQGFDYINSKLCVRLKPLIVINELEASLAAVLKTKNLQTIYLSTRHAGSKPDFHLREGFQIQRSTHL